MANKLTILRNETQTYQVHMEYDDPHKSLVGGLSLNREHLKIELEQHGCPEETSIQALQDLDASGSVTLLNCGELN